MFLGKMQVISALKANTGSFQQILVKYLPFPHPDISLITYFNIGYTKTLVKLREKWLNSPGVVHIPIFQRILGTFLIPCSKF